jgi:hypothetical protein
MAGIFLLRDKLGVYFFAALRVLLKTTFLHAFLSLVYSEASQGRLHHSVTKDHAVDRMPWIRPAESEQTC